MCVSTEYSSNKKKKKFIYGERLGIASFDWFFVFFRWNKDVRRNTLVYRELCAGIGDDVDEGPGTKSGQTNSMRKKNRPWTHADGRPIKIRCTGIANIVHG